MSSLPLSQLPLLRIVSLSSSYSQQGWALTEREWLWQFGNIPPNCQDILLLYVEKLGVLANLATSLALRCKLSFWGLPSSIRPLSNFAYSTIFPNLVPIKVVLIFQTLTLEKCLGFVQKEGQLVVMRKSRHVVRTNHAVRVNEISVPRRGWEAKF